MFLFSPAPIIARGGFLSGIVSWFIRVVIYDICVTTIQDVLGVSRMVALFIFLGIMLVIGFVGYLIKQRSGASLDDY
jgi:hypothetical protein